jgi:acyl dehydratase
MTDTQQEFERATVATIDERDIERDHAAVGVDVPSREQEYISTATPEAIRNFAHSYGDPNPIYTDPDYGPTTRWGGQVAPQMMTYQLNAPLRGDKPDKRAKGGSYRGIHAFVSGGSWEWYRPVFPGDTIYSFRGLESVEDKPSEFAGRSIIRTIRYVKMNQRAEIVGIHRTIVINTERKAARDRGKYADIPDPAWTDEELAKIDEVYAGEGPRGAQPRWWEDVQVGEALGPMMKGPLTTTDMIVFHAGGYGFVPYGLKTGRLAYENRHRIAPFYIKDQYGVPDVAQRVHWNNEWAQAIGNPRAYDYGVLRQCWMYHHLQDWMGDDAWIVREHDQIRKFNYQGDVQRITGEVTAKHEEGDSFVVDVAFRCHNQRGEETAMGEATLALPSRQHGPVVLPVPPAELQRRATEVMKRHGELARESS